MSGLNLNAFTENASRFGARLQETITERTRDLAVSRGAGSSYFDAPEDKIKNIRKQLDSNSDREKLDGLKRLIALISKGRNVSEFFPQVVKNVASQNLEIRKLVYIYLLRYAESEPDLALLSINTFQKDLTDPNPLIRAMALRVLSGINVPMIGNIIVLAIKKCSADVSPYVRKAAALALIKCYSMDTSHLASLIPILSTLLKDKSPLSMGSVALAFDAICPTRLDLLHQNYRRLCRMLIDVDEWGQVNLLDLLARYARSMLSQPVSEDVSQDLTEQVDQDLQLLLSSAEPLFMSRNSSVILAVTRVFYYLAPTSQRKKVVNPLLRLLSTSKEVERIVLAYLVVLTHESPILFSSCYTRFLIRATDIMPIKRDKLRILLHLVTVDNYQAMLREFVDYAEGSDEHLVTDAIRAIGRCAEVIPESVPMCLSVLMDFINKFQSDAAITSSVIVLKSLVQSQLQSNIVTSSSIPPSSSTLGIIAKLAAKIDEVTHPSARACVVWLVGQYSAPRGKQGISIQSVTEWAPDVLRKVAKSFASESTIVKLQIITLASKLHLISPEVHALTLLTQYVLSLARYDSSYDVRDRARMISSMLAGTAPNLCLFNGTIDDESDESGLGERTGVVLRRDQVRLVLFEGKVGVVEKKVKSHRRDLLGSLEVIIEKPMSMESRRRLPDWPEEGTDPSLRDSVEDRSPSAYVPGQSVTRAVGAVRQSNTTSPVILTPMGGPSPVGSVTQGGAGSRGGWTNLDKFYESEEEEEVEEVEEEEQGEDESEEEMDQDHGDGTSSPTHFDQMRTPGYDEDEDGDGDCSEDSDEESSLEHHQGI